MPRALKVMVWWAYLCVAFGIVACKKHIIEHLAHPVEASLVEGAGSLALSDGRRIRLHNQPFSELEKSVLAVALRDGLEMDSDGRIWVIMPIHHWCGNDPVDLHKAKVELHDLLACVEADGAFLYSPNGWNKSQYYACCGPPGD